MGHSCPGASVSHREVGEVAAPPPRAPCGGTGTACEAVPCLARGENSAAVITNGSLSSLPSPSSAALLPGGRGQSRALSGRVPKGRVTHSAGLHSLQAGTGAALGVLATSPGRKPRLGGPQRASCLFVRCWLQEFLDPLPKQRLAVPLRCQGRALAAPTTPDSSYWCMRLLGCKAPWRRLRLA